MVNPFTPGFGHSPAILAGRSAALTEFEATMRGELPEQRAMLVSGARGVGKTVLLSECEARAREAGWSILPLHTASTSLTAELRSIAVARLRDLDPNARSTRLTGAGASGFSASRSISDRYEQESEPLGDLLDRLATLAASTGHGVMIVLDEVQSADRHQLHEVTQHIQDLMRHHPEVLFAAAGIRSGLARLLDHEKTTFLRRAHRLELGPVEIGTATEAIRQTVADTDKTITPAAVARAGEISEGYPYLIQLIGSKAWRSSGSSDSIEFEDVEGSRAAAVHEMIRNVHGPALRDLSSRKRQYLEAMLEDAGPSNVGDIARRLDVDPRYQSTYRERLIEDELIEPAGRGYVRYALPYLREALSGRRDSPVSPDQGLERTRTRP